MNTKKVYVGDRGNMATEYELKRLKKCCKEVKDKDKIINECRNLLKLCEIIK